MTTEIEKTRRDMYDMLEAMRKAKKHPTMLRAFEESLEEHLEALRQQNERFRGYALRDSEALSAMCEERDQIQGRLHAIDHAYCEQSNRSGAQAREIERLNELNRIAGEELIRVQGIARQHLDDCRSAEKLIDDLSEKLTHATTVIGQQEQLIVGQRLAIADLYMAARRVNSAASTMQHQGYTWCSDPLCVSCRDRSNSGSGMKS
jgi:hypothetical protein